MTSFIGLLNNITSLSHIDLLNFNTFHYITFKKLHLLISPPVSSEKSFSVGTLSNGDKHVSSKIKIFSWKFRFYHWQQTLSVVFLEEASSFHSFLRKFLPEPRLNLHSLSVFFQQIIVHGKLANSTLTQLWSSRYLLLLLLLLSCFSRVRLCVTP